MADDLVPVKVTEETAGELADNMLKHLRDLMYQQGMYFIEIGRQLSIFKNEKLYEVLGYDTFIQFVMSPELGLKVSTAYSYMRVFELYVQKLGFTIEYLSDVPYGKLHKLAGTISVKDKKEAEEWIEKAKTLGGKDFEIEIREHRSNQSGEKHLPYPHFYRCDDCGFWRIDETEDYWCKCKD